MASRWRAGLRSNRLLQPDLQGPPAGSATRAGPEAGLARHIRLNGRTWTKEFRLHRVEVRAVGGEGRIRVATNVAVEKPRDEVAVAARADNAVKVYGTGDAAVRALDGITASFETGRFSAIMGPSGSGKSTLLHCMAGLERLSDGKVFIGDVDLTTLDEKRLTLLRREKIGFIFQAYN